MNTPAIQMTLLQLHVYSQIYRNLSIQSLEAKDYNQCHILMTLYYM